MRSPLDEMGLLLKSAGTRTISNKTWSTMAAAPLNPPPRARFRAPLRSNYIRGQSTLVICDTHICTHVNILGIYPPLDENGEHECTKDGPQYPPEPPALGALGFALRRFEQRSLLVLVSSLLVRGGEQGRLLRIGIPSRPGRGPRRRFCGGGLWWCLGTVSRSGRGRHFVKEWTR